jgi:hypothetical protein
VSLSRPDTDQLKVTLLDYNGEPAGADGSGQQIKLGPTTLYYLISK